MHITFEKSPLQLKDKIFSHTSDVLLTVDLLPFCQHVANSLLLEGDIIGHLDLKLVGCQASIHPNSQNFIATSSNDHLRFHSLLYVFMIVTDRSELRPSLDPPRRFSPTWSKSKRRSSPTHF